MRYNGRVDDDPSYTLGWTTSTIEGNLAIVAASIPALWPIIRKWFPAAFARLEEDGRYLHRHRHRVRRGGEQNQQQQQQKRNAAAARPAFLGHDQFHKERYYFRRKEAGRSPPSAVVAAATASLGGGGVVYAGFGESDGSSIGMKSMLGYGRGWGHTGTEISKGDGAEDGGVARKGGGIMRTTNVNVKYDDGPLHVEHREEAGEDEEVDRGRGVRGFGRDTFRIGKGDKATHRDN